MAQSGRCRGRAVQMTPPPGDCCCNLFLISVCKSMYLMLVATNPCS
uniref:Uncharacterized protein n=1 Tax=Arundo donax TaxID=35708 RepID=A0A0A9C2P0_ARUDO